MELTAASQRGHKTLVGFIGVDSVRYPLGRTASGGIVGVYPIDSLSWTPETARTIEAMTGEAERSGATSKTLVITGTATPLARSNLATEGWSVQEGARL